MRRETWLALLLSLSIGAGCLRSTLAARLPTPETVEDTALGPGDVFEIRVFGERELSGKYQVGPDGSIRFPFLGTMSVGGKEVAQIEREIADGLEKGQFLVDPQVSIFLEASNSKRISVLGAVSKPGTFPMIPGMTVVQAVSNAGGFTALASKDETVVTRRMGGKLERHRVAMSDVSRGDADDFRLRSGDIVFVPERVF